MRLVKPMPEYRIRLPGPTAVPERIRAAIGIPQRLRDLNVPRSQLPGFAAKAFAIKRLMGTNPRQPTEGDLLSILEAAY